MPNEKPEVCFEIKKQLETDSKTRFWEAYSTAYEDKFPYLKDCDVKPEKAAAVKEPIVVEEGEFDPPEKPYVKYTTKKNKKNVAAIVLVLVVSLLAVALGVLSYFRYQVGYSNLFANIGVNEVYAMTVGVIALEQTSILTHAFVGCLLVAAFCLLMELILSIVALASKKKIAAIGVFGLIASITLIASIVLMFFIAGVKLKLMAIVNYLNPTVSGGVRIGLYAFLLLAIIGMICGFCSYGKQKVEVKK